MRAVTWCIPLLLIGASASDVCITQAGRQAVAGLDGTVGYGYDLLYGMNDPNAAQVGTPVLNLTCLQPQLWQQNPSSDTRAVPDQLWVFTDLEVDITGATYRDSQSVVKDYQLSLGLTGDAPAGIGRLSAAVSGGVKHLDGGNSVYVRSRAHRSIYRAGLRHPMQVADRNRSGGAIGLSPQFLDLAASISNPDDAKQFVSSFGTHLLVSASFGGHVTARDSVDTTIQSSDGVVGLNGRVGFKTRLGKQSVGFSFQRNATSHVYSETTTSTTFECEGGSPQLCEKLVNEGSWSLFGNWSSSVERAPALLSAQFLPLQDLLPSGMESQRATLADFINNVYLANPPSQADSYRPSMVPLGMCDCQLFNDYCTCPEPYALVASTADGSEWVYSGGHTCCKPCDSFSPSHGALAFGGVAPIAQGAELPAAVAAIKERSSQRRAAHRTVQEAHERGQGSTSQSCGDLPCLPGADQLGAAYDMFQGVSLASPVWHSGRANSTYTWTYDLQGTKYGVPLEATPKSFASGPTVVNATVSKSQVEYASHSARLRLAGDSSLADLLDIDPMFALASVGLTASYSSQQFQAGRHVMGMGSSQQVLWTITLAPEFTLDEAFVAAVRAASGGQDEAVTAVLSSYGTHVVTRVNVGGSGSGEYLVDQHFYGKQTDESLSISFAKGLSARLGLSKEVTRTDFEQAAAGSFKLHGGDAHLADPSDFRLGTAWSETLYESPAVIQVELLPIWQVAKRVDAGAAAALHSAVQAQVQSRSAAAKQQAQQVTRQFLSLTSHTKQAPVDDKTPPGCATGEVGTGWDSWRHGDLFWHYAAGDLECARFSWTDSPQFPGDDDSDVDGGAWLTARGVTPVRAQHAVRLLRGAAPPAAAAAAARNAAAAAASEAVGGQPPTGYDDDGVLRCNTGDDDPTVSPVGSENSRLPNLQQWPVVKQACTASSTRGSISTVNEMPGVDGHCPPGSVLSSYTGTNDDQEVQGPLKCTVLAYHIDCMS